MNPHPFNSEGRTGIPDRPCGDCGLPDRDAIHKTPDGRMLGTKDPVYDHSHTRTTWVRCGNCKKQYEVPTEQPWRYHSVQMHKLTCPAGTTEAVAAQHAALIRDFAEQQTRQAPVKRPWWQFWRRGK